MHDTASAAWHTSQHSGRANEVLQALDEARLAFTQVESAQWQFLLWGETEDLQERDVAAATFMTAARQLRELTAGDVAQQARLAELEATGEQRIAMARQLAQLRIARGFDRPWPAELSAPAMALGRRVLALSDEMRAHQLAAAAAVRQRERQQHRTTLNWLLLAAGGGFTLLLVAYVGASGQATRRRRAERLLSDLIEHLPVTVWQMRRPPGRQRGFVYMREAVLQERGFTAQAARQDMQVVLSTIVEPDRQQVRAAMETCEASLQDFDMRYRVQVPGRGERWIHSRAALSREPDGTIVWNGYWADITRAKELEDEVRTMQAALEHANRELEAFSYSVSHDLRAPIAAVAGFSLSLQERCGAALDDKGRHHLARIRAAAEHMDGIVEGLLALAGVARSELVREPVDMSTLAHEVLAQLQDVDAGRAVQACVQPALQAHGDRRLLRQVYSNLLGNAWKFTRDCTPAVIEAGRTGDGGQAAFFIRDNGAGFDPQQAGRLFAPFSRLHSANEYPGTGIGLALVQRIVHRHGGRIWAESAVGRGTTVFFTLQQPAEHDALQHAARVRAGSIA